MSADYTPEPKTLEEFLGNVRFQLDNVDGYFASGLKENAHIKSECLVDAAKALEASLRRETRGDGK